MAVVAAHEAPGASVTGEVACRVVWGAVGSGKRFFFFFFVVVVVGGGWSALVGRSNPQAQPPACAAGTSVPGCGHGEHLWQPWQGPAKQRQLNSSVRLRLPRFQTHLSILHAHKLPAREAAGPGAGLG